MCGTGAGRGPMVSDMTTIRMLEEWTREICMSQSGEPCTLCIRTASDYCRGIDPGIRHVSGGKVREVYTVRL